MSYNLPPNVCLNEGFIFLALVIPGPKHPKKNINMIFGSLMEELKELWQCVDAYDSHLISNVDSTYVLSICGQSMIILHMVFLPAGLFTDSSLAHYVWMTLMQLGCSMIEKSLSLIIIKGSFL
jgi:hypothetical protein